MRTWLIAVSLSLCPTAFAGTPLPDGPHIVVSGEGKMSVKPDSARVRVGFEQRAPQPLAAKRTVDQQVERVLDLTGGFGIANEDISASDLQVSEDVDFDDDGRRISRGHVATRSVTLLLKDIDRLGGLLDACLEAGATDLSQIAFESTRAAQLRAEAKRKAVAEAREKGEQMAAAFGASLGAVYSIDSVNSRQAHGWGGAQLDRISVTGSRISAGRYLQPSVDYAEGVSAVFELRR